MAERINNFKRLMEEDENDLHVPPEIERNLQKRVESFQNFGNILELYVPKVFKVMLGFAGTNEDSRFGQATKSTTATELSQRFGGRNEQDPASR